MLIAAAELIAHHGIHNVSLRKIGESAGYSRGLASNRFGTKEALFGKLLAFLNRQWRHELGRFIGGRTGLAAFFSAMTAVENYLSEKPTHLRAMYILWYEALSSHQEVRARLAGLLHVQRHDIERWLEEGQREGAVRSELNIADTAVLQSSFIFGTVYQWLVDPASLDIPSVFRTYKAGLISVIIEQEPSPRKQSDEPLNGSEDSATYDMRQFSGENRLPAVET
jgi:AcrR family transcriptional regulator